MGRRSLVAIIILMTLIFTTGCFGDTGPSEEEIITEVNKAIDSYVNMVIEKDTSIIEDYLADTIESVSRMTTSREYIEYYDNHLKNDFSGISEYEIQDREIIISEDKKSAMVNANEYRVHDFEGVIFDGVYYELQFGLIEANGVWVINFYNYRELTE